MEHDGTDGPREKAAPAPAPGPGAVARFRKGVARGVGLVAIVLVVAFALANRQFVDFTWLFGASEVVEVSGERVDGGVPLIVLLIAAFLLGAIVGWAAMLLRGRRHRD